VFIPPARGLVDTPAFTALKVRVGDNMQIAETKTTGQHPCVLSKDRALFCTTLKDWH